MNKSPFPILEFDEDRDAIIQAGHLIAPMDIPRGCVLCFFREVIEESVKEGSARQIGKLTSEMGVNPIYEIERNGRRLALAHPGMGGPIAAGFLEELIAKGARRFIACGSCGVLDREISVGHLIVPTRAVRDEGTSYHYLPPSREVGASPEAVAAIEAVLRENQCDYLLAKTWTTDALYRETRGKIRARREEGCLTVDMEAAAFFAVAEFHGVQFGQILYGGDDVSGENWDHRNFLKHGSVRRRVFELAALACARLSEEDK